MTGTIVAHAVTAALCAIAASPARAGSISLTTELGVTPRSGTLGVTLKVTNSGDEVAEGVMAGARFAGQEARARAGRRLSPGESMEVALDIAWAQGTPGQWPLTTTVDYTDRNGYAFQALQVALVSAGAASPALIAVVKVDVGPVAQTGRVEARLKSLSKLVRHARVQFVVPRGLEVDPPARALEMRPWADAELSAKILNRAALPGSRYPVFVTAEYDDDTGHHATLANGMVEIVSSQAASASYAWIAAAALTVAWLVVLAYRRDRRGNLSGAAISGPP